MSLWFIYLFINFTYKITVVAILLAGEPSHTSRKYIVPINILKAFFIFHFSRRFCSDRNTLAWFDKNLFPLVYHTIHEAWDMRICLQYSKGSSRLISCYFTCVQFILIACTKLIALISLSGRNELGNGGHRIQLKMHSVSMHTGHQLLHHGNDTLWWESLFFFIRWQNGESDQCASHIYYIANISFYWIGLKLRWNSLPEQN